MATATKKNVEIPQPVLHTRVTLDLSLNEAETLAIIMARIGGDPDNSRRKYCDQIRFALKDVGITSTSVYQQYRPFRDNDDEYRISHQIITTGMSFNSEPQQVPNSKKD